MKCPKCGSENPEGSKFCNECGATLDLGCSQCGKPNPASSKLCNQCGYNLTSPLTITLPKDLTFDEKLAKIQKYLPRARGVGEAVEKPSGLRELLP